MAFSQPHERVFQHTVMREGEDVLMSLGPGAVLRPWSLFTS